MSCEFVLELLDGSLLPLPDDARLEVVAIESANGSPLFRATVTVLTTGMWREKEPDGAESEAE